MTARRRASSELADTLKPLRPYGNSVDAPQRVGHDRRMSRYAFPAAPSAVADAPKAAVVLAVAAYLAAFPAAFAAAAPFDGARS